MATKEWVIIASERARRPHEYVEPDRELTEARPAWVDCCPFCPGNEEPPEMERLRIPAEGTWQTRVVANKYPALSLMGERVRTTDGLYRNMSGVGHHEIVVQTPAHNTCLALMSPEAVMLTLRAFQMRGVAYAGDARIEHILYFENHGLEAGCSLAHPHAQMVGLPMVPGTVRGRTEEAQRHFDDTGRCVYCDEWRAELSDGARIIDMNAHFVAFVPYAAFSPFHTWIMPRRHGSSFLSVEPAELAALASIMRNTLRRLYVGLRDPDYNYIIRSTPLHACEQKYLHWYITIIPRISEAAGFELGSGMFINPSLPEESAAFLRAVDIA